MKDVFTLCFFAIFTLILLSLISPLSPAFKGVFLCGAGTVFFLFFFKKISPVAEFLKRLGEEGGYGEFFSFGLKALGLSLLVGMTASFCRDMGEESIAGKVELCGKASLLTMTLPILQKLLELMEGML